MADRSRVPLRSVLRGPRGALLGAYLLTEFAAGVDGLSYAAVLPVAAADLDGLALYAPALTATGVVSVAFMAVGAFLYGRLGPRVQLWIATAVWLTGAAVTALAPAMAAVVAGMALRGAGAGLMAGAGMAVISGLFPEPRERERALGLYALMWVVPSLVGPAVNGALLATLGWRVALAWPAVLLLAGRALIARNLRIVAWRRAEAPARVRGAGAFLAVAGGLVLVQVGVVAGSAVGIVGAVLAAGALLAGPFRRALRVTVPEAPQARSGGWMLLLVCASYFGVVALVPLLAARYVDADGVVGTVLVSIGPLTWALLSGSGITARLSPRAGYRVAAVGFPLGAAGVAGWALTGPDATGASPVLAVLTLGGASVLIGAAMGTIYPKVMVQTFEGFREEGGTTRAHGGAVLSLSEDVGTAVGATLLTGLAARAVGAGAEAVAWTAAGGGVVLVVAWVLAGRARLWGGEVSAGR